MDQIRHAAAAVINFVRTGQPLAGDGSDSLGGQIGSGEAPLPGLEAALQAAGQDDIRGVLGPLLELADALTALSQQVLAPPQPGAGSASDEEAEAEAFTGSAAARQLMRIGPAVTAYKLLLRHALPACDSQHDRGRLLAADALLLVAAEALPGLALRPLPLAESHTLMRIPAFQSVVLHSRQMHAEVFDSAVGRLLDGMAEALSPAHELPPQLAQPQALAGWLRPMAAALQVVKESDLLGLKTSESLDAFTACMAALTSSDERLEEHVAAVCADSQLMGELATLTAAVYAALPGWRHADSGGRGERARASLLTWVAGWIELPWPEGSERARPAAVQAAAALILQGEARRVRQLALPETAQAVRQWQQAIDALARLSDFVLVPYWAALEDEYGFEPLEGGAE
ncbi:hypothetical protein ABPG75_010581 [Micractinium tetrahymenae]